MEFTFVVNGQTDGSRRGKKESTRKQVTHKFSGIKSRLACSKKVPVSGSRSNCVDCHRQQGAWDEVRITSVENTFMVQSKVD